MLISALIQVRMSSRRLPGKALLNIAGIPAIERLISGIRPSRFINEIIICTTAGKDDDPLEDLARRVGVRVFRGEVENVVKRFYDASSQYPAETLVRIGGDCPVLNYETSDLLIESHIEKRADFTLLEENTTPVGLFPQVISFNALERLTSCDIDFKYSEFMLYYFINNPKLFYINTVSAPAQYRHPDYRLTLDYEEDLAMFNSLFAKMHELNMEISMRNIMWVLRNYPEIPAINSNLIEKYRNIYAELNKEIKRAASIKIAHDSL